LEYRVYDSHQVYETVFYCRKCGSEIRLVSGPEELADIPCSGCGRKRLQDAGEFLRD
jgi:DNA-directed RNA polymerase subunit RPC12/RpoP